MFLKFKVSSKDRRTLEKFLSFLQRLTTSSTILKHFSKQKKRKVVTILKSPHVNKTAQEQFEFRFYNKEFLVNSTQPFTFFLIIKKTKNLSFPGLKLEVKSLLNVDRKNRSLLERVDPDNIVLICDKSKTFNTLTFQKKYIQLFDCYGELRLKKIYPI
uniref:Ribosomal protein S10 n=1 Tax=Kryptoperidinium foliaceum endosymbiont TaxID=1079369 RepID=I6N5T6_9STRA|nr:ribosomal protein S10 [Kryptoperidinium foliaceum endosymbiont]